MKAHQAQVASIIPFSWVDGPGNRFVLFLQGCNFNCVACHNPQTIPLHTPRAVA
ncbi:MAG: 4Fe-4S cluster-binding domain-containing protein, partial [Streptomycetaceae bacterium]